MSSLSFLFLLMIISFGSLSQDTMSVIHVKGSVKNLSKGKFLKRGSVISTESNLKFSSKEDIVAAISMGNRGRVILKPISTEEETKSELKYMVADIYIPISLNAATRGKSVSQKPLIANSAIRKAQKDKGVSNRIEFKKINNEIR